MFAVRYENKSNLRNANWFMKRNIINLLNCVVTKFGSSTKLTRALLVIFTCICVQVESLLAKQIDENVS
jgi:putative transposon-encoded protein